MCQPDCLLGLGLTGTGVCCLWCLLQITDSELQLPLPAQGSYLRKGLPSLCTTVHGNSLLQHTLEIHHSSKTLSFKSFADLFSYDVWSTENHSVHHRVCAVVQGEALAHCGNSSLQERSCEIQKCRCAMEQESRYSSLGHLHQKKKWEHELSMHLWWIMCSHMLVKTTGHKKLHSIPWDHQQL